ncbi:hypothetical protein Rfer_4417 (plasmid) [Rhodoferax ferrireducens T118]|uniref:Uncharacterized protein n=1 Tax=Albidiferax ferrireducens (strain ATCC BAA-621 / DSM 15236 / T118) TaxID=338969 RepID=Q21Q42_ALBFT|nr:hypothetical protein [Rhodoferax ferrireducens]ABD72103.1 hypothetical protein Rfer_4417 [Rhodoferax ferrireducens T118]
MSETTVFIASNLIGLVSIAISSFVIFHHVRGGQREVEFYTKEHVEKLGTTPDFFAKVSAWNAALGGPAPKWHWIKPVSPFQSK